MRPAPEAGAPLEHCSASASMLPFPAVCWGSLLQSGVLFAVPCCSVSPCCVTLLLEGRCKSMCTAHCTAGRGQQAGLLQPRHGRVAALQAQAGARPGAQMRVSLPPTPSLVITFDEDDDGAVEEAEEAA